MTVPGAQMVIRALEAEKIRLVFGIPGTHNIELYDALCEVREKIVAVLVTDEQSASFMADGVARSSGNLAVVNVVPGAGLTHALSGIAEAFLDQIPMLVLACGIREDTHAAFQLHAVDQVAIARPVCKAVFSVKSHGEIYVKVREAVALARCAPPGPVMVEVPANLYFIPGEVSPEQLSFVPAAPQLRPPEPSTLEPMVQCLAQAKSIGLYAGRGALGAMPELLQLAERLDALVFTTISGKGIFPENHPRWVWNTLGATVPTPLRSLAEELDCLLAIGCRFGEVATGSYGCRLPENWLHIDIDAGVLNRNYKARYTLQADALEAMLALLSSPQLPSRPARGERLARLAQAHQEVRHRQAMACSPTADKVSPVRLFFALQTLFGPQTIYTTDSGNGTFLAMEHLRLNHPHCFLAPVDYSCMGYSIPAAIGAKLSLPERPVVALVGDGAFLMTGLELLTAATYSVGVVACILGDGELGQIAQFQQSSMQRKICTSLAPLRLEDLAHALSVEYILLAHDGEIEAGLRRAREISGEGRPVLVEVPIDYSAPTWFTTGVVKTNFLRFPWKDRLRLIGRVLKRKLF